MTKRYLALFLAVLLLLAGCKSNSSNPISETSADDRKTIGICLPDKEFTEEATVLSDSLSAAGYLVETEFANNDPQIQQLQVENLLSRPVDCLIICAIDSLSLTQPLRLAKEKNIPVLAFDRMLMYSDAVSAAVVYDTYALGQELANYILEKTQPATRETPVTVEFFMGSPEDNNAYLFHEGLLSSLNPYFDMGQLIVPSGRSAFEDVCIQNANAGSARDRFLTYLDTWYAEAPPEVLFTYNREMAQRCMDVLPEEIPHMPILLGIGERDSDTLNAYGYFDRVALASHCAQWAKILLENPASLSKKTTQNNGLTDVPVYLQAPTIVK